jgi:heme/copper-type cytochrome/quinol oxidase subunit 2
VGTLAVMISVPVFVVVLAVCIYIFLRNRSRRPDIETRSDWQTLELSLGDVHIA